MSELYDGPDPLPAGMNCLEVCGGQGDSERHLRRPGLDVWVRSRSNRVTESGGGDLHLISSCASGRITRILVADVCGFGPLFNELAARLRGVMKRNVNAIGQARPVRQMGAQLAATSRDGGFASTLMSTYFASTRSLTVCNAGHPPPLLFRRDLAEWSYLKMGRHDSAAVEGSFGVVAPSDYQQFTTMLAPGDLMLAFSNSLAESRDATGRTLGLAGVLQRIRTFDAAEPAALAERLFSAVRQEHAGNLDGEDATVVVCQATETPVGWRNNLLAPLRLLRPVSDRTGF